MIAYPSIPTDCTHSTSYLTDEGPTAFLVSLQSEISRIAYGIYQAIKQCYHLSVATSPEDLAQEGMLAAWQAICNHDASKLVSERSLQGYCIIRARGAMYTSLKKSEDVRPYSLDEYLDASEDSIPHDIPESPAPQHVTSLSQRRMVLKSVRTLSNMERRVIMAHYRIDDPRRGYSEIPTEVREKLELTLESYKNARRRAISKLTRAFQQTA